MIAKRGLSGYNVMAGISSLRMKDEQGIEDIETTTIGERYAAYRIVSPAAEAAMEKSIQRYGQMSPVVCVKSEKGYELIDGFKRLRACRRLNRPVLKAKTVEFSERACKAAIIQLNRSGRSISEMEEALVLRALHLEDKLQQIEIAVLVGRHKSWVSRRIALIERLSEEVQENIRLGLITIMVGRELSKLPRGNQKAAAEAVLKHKLSTRETTRLITYLLSRPRWEHEAILWGPWEIIDRRQPRPTGIGAKLISFGCISRSLSERIKKSGLEDRSCLYGPAERAIAAAEEVVETLKTLFNDRPVEI